MFLFRYQEFLQTLGRLVKLEDANEPHYFLGGLEQNGADGKFTYIWQDDVVKVAFHIATLMPNKESDPNCNNKKMHIGNNNVTIVYNESGEDYNINTLRVYYIFFYLKKKEIFLFSIRVNSISLQ